ncbi:diguanylate cyclase [Shinella sp. CPCC 101442]|uniref:GGDEF domain-containing response regulator n=1 Tax=Shinella sp. CPCC 101442 TaxID=2932265 RepID=UPI0021538349|nr:diguanylate cyclase [Shinella sp. CPCC 101442]MCR6499820.1 diguanylate cyclase [Shinella sp. CPCC 101442]
MFSTALKYRLEKELGLAVTHCPSMAAVRAIFQSEAPEFALAVLDLNLPDAPNCEALDYVISKGIAPLVFTGSFSDATRDQILAKNVLDYVVKDSPAAMQQLVLAVDRILTSGKTRVLVVDSDPESLQRQVNLIAKQRFQITAVESGAQALEALDANSGIDMVVCDLDLADMDGFALLAEIRTRHGDDTVRVVGLSTATDRMVAARFLRAGGDEYIQKPFLVEEFNSRVFHVAAIQKRVQSLHRIAARDYLTDIYNRRYFFEAGPRLVDQAVRRGEPMSIAILDIDHFKRLNDTYGHEVGDVVLKAVARRLKHRLNDRHLLARLGGEEFGIIFHGMSLEAALDCCERLCGELAAQPIIADGEALTITVSAGLAVIAERETFDNYLNAADQFLYMAKHAGRNRVFSELSLMNALAS